MRVVIPAIALALALPLATASSAHVSGARVPEYVFHHLHLNGTPGFLLDFYQRLFDPLTTRRETIGGVDAIRSGRTLLLVTGGTFEKALPNAFWHFGWGGISLGETYLAHARREVAWEPPLPADRLHAHLRSVTPSVAASWYRDVLGASVVLAPKPSASDLLPPPEHRMPDAIVWLGDFGLLIYREDPPLFSSRGQRVDHLALASSDFDASLAAFRMRGVAVLAEASVNHGLRSAIIEGPDHLAIEIVAAGASQ